MKLFSTRYLAYFFILFICLFYLRLYYVPVVQFSSNHPSQQEKKWRIGTYHVHSFLSHDSDLTLDEIAEAAKKAKIDFVIITDHNKLLDEASIINNVLLIPGTEYSTPQGHLISLAATQLITDNARYAEQKDIYQSIHAVNGYTIIAHPTDDKSPWSGNTLDANGIEIANMTSSLRKIGGPWFTRLLPYLLAWPASPTIALAQFYERDHAALAIWDNQLIPAYAGVCAVDAHGWMHLSQNFRAWNIVLNEPITQTNANEASKAILQQIQQGNSFCFAGILGDAPALKWDIKPNRHNISIRLALEDNRVPLQWVLYRNGSIVKKSFGQEILYTEAEPGIYRAEIYTDIPNILFGSTSRPILYSNRIKISF